MKGCSKCDQTCTSVGRRRIYSTTTGNLRTDQSFELRTDYEHHNICGVTRIRGQVINVTPKCSLMERSAHGMVSQSIDPMHCLDQGVGKLIMNALSQRLVFGGPKLASDLEEMKRVFATYHEFTPSEFART